MYRAVLVGLFLLFPTSAFAEAELTLFAGYRFGGPTLEPFPYDCFAPCLPAPGVESEDSESFGLVLDLPFRPNLMFEVLISHQSSEFDDDVFAYIDIYPPIAKRDFDLTYFHLGLLRQWGGKTVSPFAAVGFGVAQLDADRPLFFAAIDEDRLSASLAGGVKIHLGKWLGVRLEARGYWADMPAPVSEDDVQLEVSSGLTFKI